MVADLAFEYFLKVVRHPIRMAGRFNRARCSVRFNP